MKESDIQRACLDLLDAERIWHERRNTGAMLGEYNGKRRFTRFGTPGVADIMVWLPYPVAGGEVLWVECKSGIGRQTAAQRAFQESVHEHGMFYIICRSVDDLRNWLRERGCIR